MTSFSAFLSSLDADAGRRGKQFENFVKWFLKNDPEWSTQVDTVWMWDEYPQRWGPDCGIDLVFKHKNGETWAVQSKCYSSEYDITKHDVDKFLSESNRKGIDKRLLIATTDRIGANARQVCEAQEKPVVRFLLSHFEDADIEYPKSLADLYNAKPKQKPTPKDHQIEAINAVATNFKDVDRGQLIMACGTGKTFTTLWIKERLNSETTLILLPSLGLLSQTLHEWTSACNQPFDVLCVCSDDSVGKKGSDEAVHSVADLAFPVTSNSEEIAGFLRQTGSKVIFSTYQSSALVADSQADPLVPSFDLAIADEAHRCAGKIDGNFSTILDGKLIRADKRLFTTATPRTYSTALKKSAEGRGVEIVGMDDETVFGKPLFVLNFGEAIRRGLLTDYQVVIIGVDSPMVASWIDSRELVKTESGIENDAESLASQVGLLKVMKDYDLRRMISFHSRVSRAESFAEGLKHVIGWVDPKQRPSGEFKTDYVSGEMPTDKRRRKLSQLKNIGSNERGLLTNARCLSEGVDVPSLDGVAFIDPRGSQVDIIQAVGRAIRLSPNKQKGTIVLPVFIENNANPEVSIEASRFKPIWDILNALKAHDDVLSEELDQMRSALGKRKGSSRDQGGFSKIEIDLPASVDKSFSESIRTHLIESVTDSWEFWYGLLEDYSEEYGNSFVPAKFVTNSGYQLGQWVSHQRRLRETIATNRRLKLEQIKGWTWDVLEEKWESNFESLKNYSKRFGNCFVPLNYEDEDGAKLGRWVGTQRQSRSQLSKERVSKLERLDGWVWDQLDEKWEEGFFALSKYCEEFNNCLVPISYKNNAGFSLGRWTTRQRQNKNGLTAERKQRLSTLAGWVWDAVDDKWESAYSHLKKYIEENHTANVPLSYKSSDGFTLGSWVGKQRAGRNKLSEEKIALLESLEKWTWDPIADRWESGFVALKEYVENFGNALPPIAYQLETGFKLGQWVGTQRRSKESLSVECRKKLESLNGWVWDVAEAKWQEAISELKIYAEKNENCLVPQAYISKSGFRLGNWVNNTRAKKDNLDEEQVKELEAVAGWMWSKKYKDGK